MKSLAIIGSNDLGKLIAHHAINGGWTISGFFDNMKVEGNLIGQYGKVLGRADQILPLYKKKLFEYIIVGVGYTQFKYRKSVFNEFKGKVPFANVIHSSCVVDNSATLGEGIFLLPGTIIDMNVELRDNVLINTGCRIAHDSVVKEHSFLGPGVTIAGNVEIGECNFIGAGSTILDGLTICGESLIGGGAVVTKNITETGVYVGIPAKKIRENVYFN
jgi:sugar O-acyltransferase (sialic acid O-acetyltransferase NeuD family)